MEKTEFIIQYLNKKRLMQQIILDYLDNEDDQANLLKILSYYENEKISEDKTEFLVFIKTIACISKNHHRSSNFFTKIEQIILKIQNDLQQNISNMEIFNIFKNNIRILLFLIKEKIIILNEDIIKIIRNKFSVYFYPEIKKFESENISQNEIMAHNKRKNIVFGNKHSNDFNCDECIIDSSVDYQKRIAEENDDSDDELADYQYMHFYQKSKIKESNENDDLFGHDLETFNHKRLIGENDDILCQLIRNDKIDEFISYINQNGINITSKIKLSDFETNSFLLKNHPTIIEYAAFFGSIQIFKYLIVNNCKIKSSIWLYSIHGMNPEIIHILEEKKIKPPKNSFMECFNESIKCHHNDFTNYLCDNYISNIDEKSKDIVFLCMKMNNFLSILYMFESKFSDFQFLNGIGFTNICLYYDYINLAHFLIQQDEIDINKRTKIIIENQKRRIKNEESVIHIALEKDNKELLKIILSNPKIDVN